MPRHPLLICWSEDRTAPKTGFNSALHRNNCRLILHERQRWEFLLQTTHGREDTQQSKQMKMTGWYEKFLRAGTTEFQFDYNNPRTSLQHHCARTAATLCLQSMWTPSGSSTTPRCVINSTHSAVSLNASTSTTNATDNFIGLYLCNQRSNNMLHGVTNKHTFHMRVKCFFIINYFFSIWHAFFHKFFFQKFLALNRM